MISDTDPLPIQMTSSDFLSLRQILVGLAFLIIARIVRDCFRRYEHFRTFKLSSIPGPEPSFISGNLFDHYKEKSYLHVAQEWKKKYGKVYGYFHGYLPTLCISDASLIHKLFVKRPDIFVDRTPMPVLVEPFTSGIFFAEGNRWRYMRKALVSTFSASRSQSENGIKFIELSVDQLTAYLSEKDKLCRSNGQPLLVHMHSLMKSTTLHIISGMSLDYKGVEIKENEEHVIMLDEFMSHWDGCVFQLASCSPMLKSFCSFLGQYVTLGRMQEDILAQLRYRMSETDNGNTTKSHNIFEKMIQLHKEGSFTTNEVLGNCLSFLTAGFDTTATTLTALFWCLSKYPDIQNRLRSDLISNGHKSEYLRMVINEVLRLYPSVITGCLRIAYEDVTIDGVTVKKDWTIAVNASVIHNDPDYWPEPEKFDPERFADMSKIQPCTFVPFGVGQRICIGYHLAILQIKLIASELLLQYQFELVKPKKLVLALSATTLSTPTEPVVLELKRLNNNNTE